jgi:DNA-binding MarR family transcriptional regulator
VPEIDFSYSHLRALLWLYRVGGILKCEGTNVWTLEVHPTVAVRKSTVLYLAQFGLIERKHVQTDAAIDDYELTPLGQEHITTHLAEFDAMVIRRIMTADD